MKRFLADLKRRRVVRVAIVYLVMGLVVVEAALVNSIRYPVWDAILSDPRYTAVITGMNFEPWDLSRPS